MENKKTFCGASTHTRTAPLPKVFLFLLCFLIFNSSIAFGSSTVKYDLEDFVDKFNYIPDDVKENMLSTTQWDTVKNYNLEYDNLIIWAYFGNSSLEWQNEVGKSYIGFGFTNSEEISFYKVDSNYSGFNMDKAILFNGDGSYRNSVAEFTFNHAYGFFLYSEPAAIGTLTTNDKWNMRWPGITDGWNKNYTYNREGFPFSMNDVIHLTGYEPIPSQPWFEFTGNKVGTTTLENIDENINTYYPTSFKRWSNSYMTGREIGYLYIPKPNSLDDLFMPVLNVTKSNLSMTNSWEYKEYDYFIEEETSAYIKYSINLRNELLTAPYYYNINLTSIDENTQDINIIFVTINPPTTGGIIVDNSGDEISGDATKDETTLGDINNTIGEITEPYNPNDNILNNMSSGEILDNMGYEQTEDPNKDLWDTIINGLKETLTGSGEQTFSFKLRKTEHTISSNDLYIPNGTIKTFIALFVNFKLLMEMFQFIKRTIDQINEGNLKVMHEVDADCYFF